MMIEPLYDFSLTAEQEARARTLHESSIILDMLFQGPVGTYSLPEGAEETFINVNDGTCEGITYHDMPAFTVQFHPEACAGPKDTEELFGRFIQMMRDYKKKEGASCR